MDLSCGANHISLCTDEGEVFSWGEGRFGALGNHLSKDMYSPTSVQVVITGSKRKAFITKVSSG
jgi:alpha-tubulin suppressor-like RCC1 family protein